MNITTKIVAYTIVSCNMNASITKKALATASANKQDQSTHPNVNRPQFIYHLYRNSSLYENVAESVFIYSLYSSTLST